jgi:hypothetical protein
MGLNPHERQEFDRQCDRFSPGIVHNPLLHDRRLRGAGRRGLPGQRHGAANPLAACCGRRPRLAHELSKM